MQQPLPVVHHPSCCSSPQTSLNNHDNNDNKQPQVVVCSTCSCPIPTTSNNDNTKKMTLQRQIHHHPSSPILNFIFFVSFFTCTFVIVHHSFFLVVSSSTSGGETSGSSPKEQQQQQHASEEMFQIINRIVREAHEHRDYFSGRQAPNTKTTINIQMDAEEQREESEDDDSQWLRHDIRRPPRSVTTTTITPHHHYSNNRRRLLYNLSTNTTTPPHKPPPSSSSSTHNATPPHAPPPPTSTSHRPFPPMPPHQILKNKNLILQMFTHAYDSYMYNAFPASELKPLSCTPGTFHLVRIPAVTLIDTLDTLLVFGNYTEFARSVERLRMYHLNYGGGGGGGGGLFDIDENVSVFETNIRVLGGLLSGHQMMWKINPRGGRGEVFDEFGEVRIGPMEDEEDVDVEELWVYDDFLLALAVDLGDRLMPAFKTNTGIPYGTVNLRHGVPIGETTVASLAGGGTLTLEFELLTRLTGDTKYGNAAILATRALFLRRDTNTNLLGKHIDIQTGAWKEARSGIGSNSDSFYEYLLKFYILYQKEDFWTMFLSVYKGVYKYVRTDHHWFGDVEMNSRGKTHVFESLAAFWPGLLVLLGELAPAKNLMNAMFLAREELGFLPERFQYQNFRVDGLFGNVGGGGGKYPLRPELLESCYFLHRATKSQSDDTSTWLWPADFSLHALEQLTKTECGYATVRKVTPKHNRPNSSSVEDYYNRRSIELEDEMPSYFLSETIKYLYLMFDEDNILHDEEKHPYIFTTEAHPVHFVPDPRESETNSNNHYHTRGVHSSKQPNEKWSKFTTSSKYWHTIKQLQMKDNSPALEDFNLTTLLTKDHLQFSPKGKADQLSQHCPNYHHPSFGWVHALGLDGGLNYEENYAERMMMLTTRINREDHDNLVCHAPTTITKQQKTPVMSSNSRSTLHDGDIATITGAEPVKLNMGPKLGFIEVAMMADGFYAHHLNSDETIEVSTVNMLTQELSQQSWMGSTNNNNNNNLKQQQSSEPYLLIMTRQGESQEKRVVFADWHNNKFFCYVELYRGTAVINGLLMEELMDIFPCSPAMFGPSVMPALLANDGAEVIGELKAPLQDNEVGCSPVSSESVDSPAVQLVWRGECSFEDKCNNLKKSSDAMIVINDESDHLFLMASSKVLNTKAATTPTNNNNGEDDDDDEDEQLPLSVLISKTDGKKILAYINKEKESYGNDSSITASVRLVPQLERSSSSSENNNEGKEWPQVTTTTGAMQILGNNGWGLHVEQTTPGSRLSSSSSAMNWQLFVVQHSDAEESGAGGDEAVEEEDGEVERETSGDDNDGNEIHVYDNDDEGSSNDDEL